jgi:hypothetical protein
MLSAAAADGRTQGHACDWPPPQLTPMGALPMVPPGTVAEAEERVEDELWGCCLRKGGWIWACSTTC